MTDVVERLNAELADAPPVCTCSICSSPRFVFCPVGWTVLLSRLQWVMSELEVHAPEDGGGGGRTR
jgi:hypothetical protein